MGPATIVAVSDFVPYASRLRQLAAKQPEHDALIVHGPGGREAYSYAAYNEKVDAFAATLATRGVGEGSGVVVVSPNSSAAVIASSAAWRLGAFVAPISYKSTQADLDVTIGNIRRRTDPVFVLSDHVAAGNAAQTIALEALHESPNTGTTTDRNPSPARAIPSGGTTGRAKLIVDKAPWGHRSGAPITRVLDAFGWRDAHNVLIYSPMYHNVGQTLTHLAFADGKTAVVMDRFDAARALEIIAKERIEFFFAVPTHMQRFLELPNFGADELESVKSMYHAGAFCPVDLKKDWISVLGADRVWELYGATDGSGFAVINGTEWLRKKGSVGRAFASDIRILGEDLDRMPAGKIGQIYMQMDGLDPDDPGFDYLGTDLPPATPDGYRSVGDMGWLDADGYLYIADRRTDMIITGGANVFPAEVEAVLKRHPAVRDVAVVGLTDKTWGKRVHAVVVAKDPDRSPAPEDLDRFMSREIVGYKKPKTYEFRTALPYTDVGKVDRRRLAEAHSSDRDQESGRWVS